VVRKQATAGVDVIDDGEMSKPSYATYPKDRLAGFQGASQTLQYRDLVDFPGMAQRVFGDPGRARRKTPACTGPITLPDPPPAPRPRRRPDGRRQLEGRPARGPIRGGLPDGGVPGRDLALLPQRALSESRGVPVRHRRGDADRVRDRDERGLRAPGRLPRSGHG